MVVDVKPTLSILQLKVLREGIEVAVVQGLSLVIMPENPPLMGAPGRMSVPLPSLSAHDALLSPVFNGAAILAIRHLFHFFSHRAPFPLWKSLSLVPCYILWHSLNLHQSEGNEVGGASLWVACLAHWDSRLQQSGTCSLTKPGLHTSVMATRTGL
ncbi:hypothetical protein EYF80_008371 [Liparis tanakae]|uniref:Uncharacterized protein n=1 Tax=Liparis tanakae TaxID=230148 RepID=A0A4Z2IU25_9TELE|nr:hypothetical protein EYF80_008371 [Liparis tanakae]